MSSYPPPFQDLATLAEHICCGESTIENWVRLGLFRVRRRSAASDYWNGRSCSVTLPDMTRLVQHRSTSNGGHLQATRAAAANPHNSAGDLPTGVRAYKSSPKFDALAPSTRVSYGHLLNWQNDRHPGSLSDVLSTLLQAFLDGFADRSAQHICAQTASKPSRNRS